MAALTQSRIDALSTISSWNYIPVIGYISEASDIGDVETEIKKLVKHIFNTGAHQPTEAPKFIQLLEIRSNILQEGQTRSYIIVALSIVCILIGFHPLAAALAAIVTAVFAWGTSEGIRSAQNMIDKDLKRGIIPHDILKRLEIKEDACPEN